MMALTYQAIGVHLALSAPQAHGFCQRAGLDPALVSLDTIRETYIRELRAQASRHRADTGEDLVRERVLTERIDRELKQWTLAEKRGQLVNVAQLEPQLEQMIAAFRTELCARDDKLAAELGALYGHAVDPEIIHEHTRAALEQLAGYGADARDDATPSRAPVEAAGAADDDAMGDDAAPDLGEGERAVEAPYQRRAVMK